MRIESVTSRLYRLAPTVRWEDSTHRISALEYVVTDVETDSGLVGTWHMSGAATPVTQTFDGAPTDWHVQGVGDFNGDGRDDILWRNDAGLVGTWHMHGAAAPETQTFTTEPANWHIDGVGDFNADGKDDILWRSDAGQIGIWFMNGATTLSRPLVGSEAADWHILNTHFEVL